MKRFTAVFVAMLVAVGAVGAEPPLNPPDEGDADSPILLPLPNRNGFTFYFEGEEPHRTCIETVGGIDLFGFCRGLRIRVKSSL